MIEPSPDSSDQGATSLPPTSTAPAEVETALTRSPATASEVLQAVARPPTGEQRTAMTISCRDTDAISKVPNAGAFESRGDVDVQVMHNGLVVVSGGYYGDWMADVISGLDGHHEPQEELVFHRVLERIDGPAPTMMELGCFWAYYSCWFLQRFPGGIAIAAEPDPDHLDIGRQNAKLNSLPVRFHQAAAGASGTPDFTFSSELHEGVEHTVVVRSVEDLMVSEGVDQLDLLHVDIQGFELDVLETVAELVAEGRIRFVIVSTHHHLISNDPILHDRCIDWIQSHGGHVIAEHSVVESFSGDGLIAASFDPRDDHFDVTVSHNRASMSLFQAPEVDLAELVAAYEDVRSSRREEAPQR